MKSLFNKIQLRKLSQPMAWMLVIAIILISLNPADFAFAVENNYDGWEVSYSLETEEGDGIQTDNDIMLSVQKGQEVFLTMQMLVNNEDNTKRFKDTFKIKVPGNIYDALVEENGEPGEWFESDLTESGYLLELRKTVASGSSARRRSRGTGSNARRHSRSSDSNAAEKFANDDIVELEFRFVRELRNERDPEDVEIDDMDFVIPFTAPESTALVLSADRYDCEITKVADVFNTMLFQDSDWKVYWSLKINRSGNDITPKPGEPVQIEVGDIVTFGLDVVAIDDTSVSFDETFSVTLPSVIYDVMKDGFQTSSIMGADIFEYSADIDGDPDPVLVNISFTQALKNAFEGKNAGLSSGKMSFGFTAEEEIVIKYTPGTDSDSCDILIGEIEEPKLDLSVVKSKVVSFNKDSVSDTNSPVAPGDYIIYSIDISAKNLSEDYTIPEGAIMDYFNADIFRYVDMATASSLEDIGGPATDPDTAIGKKMNEVFASDSEYREWEEDKTVVGGENGAPDYDNCAGYGNEKELKIVCNPDDLTGAITMYICLQLKNTSTGSYPYSDLENHVKFGGKSDTETIDTSKYYDAAIRIISTTKMTAGTNNPIVMKTPVTYPENVGNPVMEVDKDDIVTFVVHIYNQGNTDYWLKNLSINIPLGLELMDEDDLEQAGYMFATSAQHTAQPNRKPNHNRHINKYIYGSDYRIEKFKDVSVRPEDQAAVDQYKHFYEVKQYTYKPNTYDESREKFSKIAPGKAAEVYITCKVLGIDAILDAAGITPSEATDAQRKYAEAYGYLISTEVSAIVDGEETDVQGAEAVQDNDSFNDNNPFNDWFICDGDNKGKLKKQSLWLEEPTKGERDQLLGNSVTCVNGKVNPRPDYDEDDHDYAMLFTAKPETVGQQEIIAKEINMEEYSAEKIKSILDSIDADAYRDYKYLNNFGAITELNTIVPYSVYINKDGSRTMTDVRFTDDIPVTMEFLRMPGGVKPVVQIQEIVEVGSRKQVMMDIDGNGTLKPVEIIDPEFAEEVVVKDAGNDEYRTTAGKPVEKPSGLLTGDIWDVRISTSEDGVEELAINFGDIENNAFKITYFAVVKGRSNVYRNNATVEFNNISKTIHNDFSRWSDSGGLAYGKQVLNPDGEWVNGFDMTSVAEGQTALTYKLLISVSSTEEIKANTLVLYDYISDLGMGEANIADVGGFKYYNGLSEAGAESVKEEEKRYFVAKPSADKKSVTIQNRMPIAETPPGQSNEYEVHFTVVYNDIPHGSSIENSFGRTTVVDVPLKLELTKIDGDTKAALFNAEFELTYADENKSPVMTSASSREAVTLTTGTDGKASAEFYLEENKKETGENYYYLLLTETSEPDGYYKLGGLSGDPQDGYQIRLKVTVDDNGRYSYQAVAPDDKIFVLTTGTNNQIELLVKNYKKPSLDTSVTLRATKNLNGRTQRDGEFQFEASLSSLPVGVTAEYGSSQSLAAGQSIPAVNGPNGSITFPEVTFKGVSAGDTAVFTLKETIPANPGTGITYSTTTYVARITFTENVANGSMQASVAYYEQDGTTPVSAEGVTFTNIYTPERPTPDPGGGNDGGNGGGGGGGGGNGGNRPSPTPSVSIEDGDVPLGDVTEISDPVTPLAGLAGLAKTGDDGIHPFGLLLIMLLAGAGIGIVLYLRKKQQD